MFSKGTKMQKFHPNSQLLQLFLPPSIQRYLRQNHCAHMRCVVALYPRRRTGRTFARKKEKKVEPWTRCEWNGVYRLVARIACLEDTSGLFAWRFRITIPYRERRVRSGKEFINSSSGVARPCTRHGLWKVKTATFPIWLVEANRQLS